jgi:pimeloyl-ACP methyl ester carboxylesterase
MITGGITLPPEDSPGITGFPVIFLKGMRSEYLPEEDMHNIRKLFPDAELIRIPDAGHWIHADKPDAVADALRSLLYRS